MAARLYPAPSRPPEIIDLRRLAAQDLESLLEEETHAWKEQLDWDFEKSAALVRRFVDLRALNGAALIEDGAVTGYLYYVLEDNKGLIGDLYVMHEHRTWERETALVEAALDAMITNPAITRIESQLMMLHYQPGLRLPWTEHLGCYERVFMRIELREAPFGEGRMRRPAYIEKWGDQFQDEAANLIAAAYTGHVDSRINDQYRTPVGARRFLYNIMQYPGCGSFYRPASFAAFDSASGEICGISLASLVSPDCGHITQICVAPSMRGTGIGYALLARSLSTLREMGCRTASLTVTGSNREAVTLYERMGFRTARRFFAFVWEGF
jgi:ribosomal protein S18 acetylase RimI-like enzyme